MQEPMIAHIISFESPEVRFPASGGILLSCVDPVEDWGGDLAKNFIETNRDI